MRSIIWCAVAALGISAFLPSSPAVAASDVILTQQRMDAVLAMKGARDVDKVTMPELTIAIEPVENIYDTAGMITIEAEGDTDIQKIISTEPLIENIVGDL